MRQLITRIDDDLHRRLKERAAAEGRSVNAFVTDALSTAVGAPGTRTGVRDRARALGLAVLPEPPQRALSRARAIALTRGSGSAVSQALAAERGAR